MLEFHLKSLDLCYFEVAEAFKGLADENVWKRPDGGLLSVGELAGHIAYWEVVRFAGDAEDGSASRNLSNCKITSPLLDPRFGYYTSTVESEPSAEQLAMTGEQVLNELLRIHGEVVTLMRGRNLDLSLKAPHWHTSYNDLLRYVAFHIAYHTGQMYSVRHLLREETPDN